MTAASEPSMRSLQRAKRSLLKKYGERDWFHGVGIVPTEQGFGLRLNVDPDAVLDEGEIPSTYRTFTLEIARTRGYERRED